MKPTNILRLQTISIICILLVTFNACSTSSGCKCLPKSYMTDVEICGQTWKKRNLAVVKYRNGDPIPRATKNDAWDSLKTGAWCYYNDDSATGDIYGKLYNWYAVNDTRGLAPQGWHVPTYSEWMTLANCLGTESIAGRKLKEAGTKHWIYPNDATDSTDFTALPGGSRAGKYLPYDHIGKIGFYWASDTLPAGPSAGPLAGLPFAVSLHNYGPGLANGPGEKSYGYSVRLVKD